MTNKITKETVTGAARAALALQEQVIKLNEQIEEYKELFREYAKGETIKEVVPGLGTVSVAKPGGGKTSTNIVFDVEQYEKLDKANKTALTKSKVVMLKPVISIDNYQDADNLELRQMCKKLGVTSENTVTSKVSAASVTIKPNV